MMIPVSLVLYPAFVYGLIYMRDEIDITDMSLAMGALSMGWFSVYLLWTDRS